MFYAIIVLTSFCTILPLEGSSTSHKQLVQEFNLDGPTIRNEVDACTDFYGHICSYEVFIMDKLRDKMINKMKRLLEAKDSNSEKSDSNLRNLRYFYRSCKNGYIQKYIPSSSKPKSTITVNSIANSSIKHEIPTHKRLIKVTKKPQPPEDERNRRPIRIVKYTQRAMNDITRHKSYKVIMGGGIGWHSPEPTEEYVHAWVTYLSDLIDSGFGDNQLIELDKHRSYIKINFNRNNFRELRRKLHKQDDEIVELLEQLGETNTTAQIELMKQFLATIDDAKTLEYNKLVEMDHFKNDLIRTEKICTDYCLTSTVDTKDLLQHLIMFPYDRHLFFNDKNIANLKKALQTNYSTMAYVFAINSLMKLDNELIYDNKVDCVRGTAKLMKYAMLPKLAKVLRTQPVVRNFEMLASHVRDQYMQRIRAASWITKRAKEELNYKLEKTKFELGSPDELIDGKTVAGIYKDLKMSENDLVSNILNARIANLRFERFFGSKENTKDEWIGLLSRYLDLMDGHFWYLPNKNSILVHPLYLDELVMSTHHVSYGVLGSSISRELSNVVLSKSYRLDKPYELKQKCVTDQHECSKSSANDMLDYLGFWAAYKSYLNKTQSSGDDFDPKDFWTSLAESYCTKEIQPRCSRLASYKRRINLNLRNYDEFSKDFECNSTSYMNRKYKCSNWVKG